MTNQTSFLTNEVPTRQIGTAEFGVRMRNLIKLTEDDLEETRLQGFLLIVKTLSALGYGEGLEAFDKAINNTSKSVPKKTQPECSHEFDEWKVSFEPGDGSFCYSRRCILCGIHKVTSKEPKDFMKEQDNGKT